MQCHGLGDAVGGAADRSGDVGAVPVAVVGAVPVVKLRGLDLIGDRLRFAHSHRDEKPIENRLGARRTSGNVHVHRQNTIDAADRRVGAFGEDPSTAATRADRNDDSLSRTQLR